MIGYLDRALLALLHSESLFNWSLLLLSFGVALGFVIGWACWGGRYPTSKQITRQASGEHSRSNDLASFGVELKNQGVELVNDGQETQSKPAKNREHVSETSTLSGQAKPVSKPKQVAAQEVSDGGQVRTKTGFQARQPISRPLGEIERRRQRFEEARREAEKNKRK